MAKNKIQDIKMQVKTIAKELGIAEETAVALSEKCEDVMWRPYGGATSFSELDQLEKAREYSYEVDDIGYKLRGIIENISNSDEMSVDEKATAISKAADDFKAKIRTLDTNSQKTQGFLSRLKEVITGTKPAVKAKTLNEKVVAFKVFEDTEGKSRWLSFSSNAFEDVEKELFTTKALEEAVEYADKTEERGPLLLYHIPSAEIGQCDFQAVQGRFLIESGTFDDTPMGRKALDFFVNTEEEHQVSIGYTYLAGDEEDGTYDWLRIRERSVCPFGTAANPWTDFSVIGDKEMHEKHMEFLTKVFGEELANDVVAKAETKTKELEQSNVRFKTTDSEKVEVADTEAFIRSLAKNLGVDEDKAIEEAQRLVSAKPEEQKAVETKEEEKEEALAFNNDSLRNLAELVTDLANAVDQLSEEVKELKKADDEKISKAVMPKLSVVYKTAPSEDESNVIAEEKAKELGSSFEPQENNPVASYINDLLGSRAAAGN